MRLPGCNWFWPSILCLLLMMGLRAEVFHSLGAGGQPQVRTPPPVSHDSRPDKPAFVGPLLPSLAPPVGERLQRVITDTFRRNDSIYNSLKKHRISELQIANLVGAFEGLFDPDAKLKPRDYYTLTVDTSGVIQRFEYTAHRQPESPLLIELLEDDLVGRRLNLPLDKRVEVIEARIVDNLTNAIRAAGEDDALTDVLADHIFGAVIDFQKCPRQGDRIEIVFEKYYRDNRFIRYGEVLLARYRGQQASQLAVFYRDPDGQRGYYDWAGKSLARAFLLKPLSFRRISSRFSRKRFHPILRKNLPHLGTDYAASQGTPVRATARGRVVHAGWKGSYGKLVEIAHPNGYRTRYAHLSRIEVRANERVHQSEIIGLVGATGRATGPHLHYELIKNGSHINPQTVNNGIQGEVLQKKYQSAFATHRDNLLELLDRGRAPIPSPDLLAASKTVQP